MDLYLTSKILTGHRRQTHEHVEAELLLEMHARQLQKILNESSMVADKIEATEQQVRGRPLPMKSSVDTAAC